MSSRKEKITQAVYTSSLLSQELHLVPINHWLSTKQLKLRLQTHLKPHTSFGTQHHRNQNTL